MKTTNILAPEILAHTTVARELQVGDLAVFTDYAGRQVGCRVVGIYEAGTIGRFAHYRVTCCGLTVPAPYEIGLEIVVEAAKIRRAV